MIKLRLKKLNKKGFTFVECICAIALFAIIGTMAFSMFSNSARYMTKSKQEDAQQTEALESYKTDNFSTVLFCKDNLVKETINGVAVDGTSTSQDIYYLKLVYTTTFGDTEIWVSVKPITPEKTGTVGAFSFKQYTTSDGRYVLICQDDVVTENKTIDPLDVSYT